MKYTTKSTRLVAIADAWMEAHPKRMGFTTKEVAAWAMEHRLYPVPVRQGNPVECEQWEQRLDSAVARTKQSARTP